MLVSANNEVEKRRPCGCSEGEAEKAVLARQRDLFASLKSCDFKRIVDELSLPDALASTIDRGCPDFSCCQSTYPLAAYWNYYTCNMLLDFPEASFTLAWLANGTAVFTHNEVSSLPLFRPDINITVLAGATYYNSFYWEPQPGAKCDFRLAFLRGYDPHCAANIEMTCDDCPIEAPGKQQRSRGRLH